MRVRFFLLSICLILAACTPKVPAYEPLPTLTQVTSQPGDAVIPPTPTSTRLAPTPANSPTATQGFTIRPWAALPADRSLLVYASGGPDGQTLYAADPVEEITYEYRFSATARFATPFLVAAGLGGLIGAGVDIGAQLYNMQPTSLGQALRCLNWGEVGVSFGAGAVAGLTGFTVFGGMTALMGTGFFANVAAGAISGVVAGQYGRLTGLVLSGQVSQAGSTLFRPQDMVLDAALGGVGSAVSYGIQRGLSGIARGVLQRLTDSANRSLGANPGSARQVLSPLEYSSGQTNPSLARLQYGNAIERMVAQQIKETPVISSLFQHVGGPNNPDFGGIGLFNGLNFDITTNTTRSIASHLSRAYGQGLIITTYSRPIGFGVFP